MEYKLLYVIKATALGYGSQSTFICNNLTYPFNIKGFFILTKINISMSYVKQRRD